MTVRPLGEYEPSSAPDGDAVVQQYWPYDGPHDYERLLEASAALVSLVRDLTNAPSPGIQDINLPYAPVVDGLLGRVSSAVGGLDQLLDQFSQVLLRKSADDTLYDDRRDRPGADTAEAAVEQLGAAQTAVRELHQAIRQVGELTTHLEHDD